MRTAEIRTPASNPYGNVPHGDIFSRQSDEWDKSLHPRSALSEKWPAIPPYDIKQCHNSASVLFTVL